MSGTSGASGALFEIPKEVLEKAEQLDKKIADLAKTANETQKQLDVAFEKMRQGASPFELLLEKMKNDLTAISGINVSQLATGIGSIATDTTKAADSAKVLADSYKTASTSISSAAQAVSTLTSKSPSKESTSATGKRDSLSAIKVSSASASVEAYKNIQVEIDKVNERQLNLIKTVREYEMELSRIKSGKGGVVAAGATDNYNTAKTELESNKALIAELEKKQQRIIAINQAYQQQVAMVQALKANESIGNMSDRQKYKDSMDAMRTYYKDLEKESASAAAKAERDREREAKAAVRAAEKARIESEKAAIKAEKDREREAKAAVRAAEKVRAAKAQQNKEANYRKNTSFQGALDFSKAAVTANRAAVAIKFLTAARDKENGKTEEGKKRIHELNEAIRKQKQYIQELKAGSEQLRNSQSKLFNISQQLGRQLAMTFSVASAKQFIKDIATATGEMELQQVALRSILQNRTKADEIFNKTKELATKSPFRVQQLVTYTKQLAAYRIESDKLFDTTKRLADVSAGLGVDMQRLILAYGQVKAAAYLRGTEVRQFTEAGVNMYGELQRYFEEVKGEAYTTAQIVDMISKRKVTFEDVEAIFKRLTDQGGIFYNMQEIQSETLYGKIEKLKDLWYLMLNDIGKANNSVISGFLDIEVYVLKHWEIFSILLYNSIALFVAIKYSSTMAKYSIGSLISLGVNGFKNMAVGIQAASLYVKSFGFSIQELKAAGLATIASLKKGLKSLGSVLNRMSFFIALEIVYEIHRVLSENHKMAADLSKEYYGGKIKIGNIRETSKSDAKKALQEVNKYLNDEGIIIKIDIEKLDEEKIKKELENELKFADAYIEKMRGISSRHDSNVKENRWFTGTFADNIDQNIKDYSVSVGQFLTAGDKVQTMLRKMSEDSDKYTESNKKAFLELSKGPQVINGKLESTEEYYERVAKFIDDLTKKGFNIYTAEDEVIDFWKLYLEKGEDAKKALADVEKVLGDPSQYAKYGNAFRKGIIDKAMIKYEWNEAIRPLIYRKYNITPKIDKSSTEKEVDILSEMIQSGLDKNKFRVKIDFSKSNMFDNLLDELSKVSKKDIKKYRDLINSKGTLRYSKNDKEFNDWYNNVLYAGKKAPKNKEGAVITKKIANAYVNYLEEYQKNVTDTWNYQSDKEKKGNDKKKKEAARNERDIWQERIKVLQDMHSQYEEMRQFLDTDKAVELVKESYAEDLQYVGMDKSIIKSFVPTKQGLYDALDELLKQLPNTLKKKKMELEREKAKLKVEIDQEKLQSELDETKRKIDNAFDGLQVRLKLKDLGLFDFEIDRLIPGLTKSVYELKKKIKEDYNITPEMENMSDAELEKKLGKDVFKRYVEDRDRLRKQEVDHQRSIIEQLVKDYKNQLTDQLAIDVWYYKEKAKIAETVHDEELAREMEKNLKQQYNKKTSEQTWKDFQGNDYYLMVFENMENMSARVLSDMKSRLEKLRNELKKLDPAQLKAITSQIEKIDEQLNSKGMGNLIGSMKVAFEFVKKRKVLEEELIDSQTRATNLKNERNVLGKEVELAKAQYNMALKLYKEEASRGRLNSKLNHSAKEQVDKAYALLQTKKSELNAVLEKLIAEGKITEEIAKQIRYGKASQQAAVQGMSNYNQMFSAIQQQNATIIEEWDQIFGTASDELKDFFEVFQKIEGGFGEISQGAQNFVQGYFSGNPAQMVQGIAQSVSGTVKVISGIFSIGDKKKERQIKRMQESVEALSRSYEKLKKAMDSAWDLINLEKYTQQSIRNLEAQAASYEAMAKAEKSKKKSDDKKAQEYLRSADDIREKIKELNESFIEELGGFGSEKNYKSAAQEFTDAWVDAFSEGSVTLDALNSKFNDIMKNIVKKQAMMRFSKTFLDPVFSKIDEIMESTVGLSTEEFVSRLSTIMPQAQASLNEVNEKFKAFAELLKLYGIDLTDSTSNLSALQQGIQGVTEKTAEALESILNSMRFYVADTNVHVNNIYQLLLERMDGVSIAPNNNPVVNELKVQTQIMSSMNSILEEVLVFRNQKGGRGFKVYME